MSKESKNLEIVNGNGKDLNISPVYGHISTDKPKSTNKSDKKIIIPKQNDKKKK